MYRIAICDDDPHQTDDLSDIVSDYLFNLHVNFVIDVFDSGELLLKALNESDESYSIILLDIEMKETNGIDTAKIIRQTNQDVLISYITSYDKYTLESFSVKPFRYLLKPVGKDEMVALMHCCLDELGQRKQYLFYSIGKNQYQIRSKSIVAIYSVFGRKLKLELEDGSEIEYYGKIKDVEDVLNPLIFVKVHSGTIINLNYISSITTQDIIHMKTGSKIPISRGRKKEFRKYYYQFMEKELLS